MAAQSQDKHSSRHNPPDREAQVVYDLNLLHTTLIWRSIAELPQYQGIPFGSLNNYANGRPIKSRKHRLILGLEITEPVPVCPIHHTAHFKVHRRAYARRPVLRWRDLPPALLLWALEHREEF